MKININNLDLNEVDDEFIPVEKIRKKSKVKCTNVKTQGQVESSDNGESDNYIERES